MNIEELRSFCLNLPGAPESFLFDDVTLVFNAGGKMFALTNLDGPLSVNLKCEPEKAIELREPYSEVSPGYHMSKLHWNTIDLTGVIPDKLIHQWTIDSYNLVFNSQSQKVKESIG